MGEGLRGSRDGKRSDCLCDVRTWTCLRKQASDAKCCALRPAGLNFKASRAAFSARSRSVPVGYHRSSRRRSDCLIEEKALVWAVSLIWRLGSESNRRRRLCRPLHDHSATPPGAAAGASRADPLNEKGERGALPCKTGAGKESRTPDLNLGKVALYQLSYSRVG